MALIFRDTFTEAAADVHLPSHTPDSGVGWTLEQQNSTTSIASAYAATDTAHPDTTDTNGGLTYSAQPNPSVADYDVEAIVGAAHTGNNDRAFAIMARYQDGNNWYAARVIPGSQVPDKKIQKCVAGVVTDLATADHGDSAPGDVWKFELRGTALRLLKNNVEVLSVTDGDITAAGKAGLAWGWPGSVTNGGGIPHQWEITEFSVTEVDAGGVELEASGEVLVEGSADLLVEKLLESSGEVLVEGEAILEVLRTLAATGTVLVEGSADLEVGGAAVELGATGQVLVEGSAELSVEKPLAASGEVSIEGSSDLLVEKILSGEGEVLVEGSAVLEVLSGLLSASGEIEVEGTAFLLVEKPLSGSAVVVVGGSATLEVIHIEPAPEILICQNCGAKWFSNQSDKRYYFSTRADRRGETKSATEIFNSGETVTHCPKCPLRRVDKMMFKGDDRTGGF